MLRRWGLSYDAILEAAIAWNDERCQPPIERSRVENQVRGALKMPGDDEIAWAIAHPLPDDDTTPRPGDPAEVRQESWRPIPLHDPAFLVPPDPPSVGGLLYSGRRHVVSGLPETMKTMISYSLLLEALRAGRKIAIVDFEMGAHLARSMLDDLGATVEEIEQMHFVTPTEPPDSETLDDIISRQIEFVLIDATAGAYDVSGLDDNSRKDAETFARMWVRPFWRANVGSLLIDHLTKNQETRGKFVIGSERKVGQADVHISFESLRAFSRGHRGLVKVSVMKDRPGHLNRPTAAVFELLSDPFTNKITCTQRDPHPTDELGHFRPTTLMSIVSRYMQAVGEPCSRNQVERSVKGTATNIRLAIDALLQEGYLVESDGPRGARLVEFTRPYSGDEPLPYSAREDDDTDDEPDRDGNGVLRIPGLDEAPAAPKKKPRKGSRADSAERDNRADS
jgi:KaiC/GvpD/RAD55 family RecA-like ATPase